MYNFMVLRTRIPSEDVHPNPQMSELIGGFLAGHLDGHDGQEAICGLAIGKDVDEAADGIACRRAGSLSARDLR